MMKLDTIIAVKDIEKSVKWYEQVFNFKNLHGGNHFAILTTQNNDIVLCLHPWEQDDHPTMRDQEITPGNGLILYLKTDKMEEIRENARKVNAKIDEDIHINPKPNKREFSMWDLDGYYIIVTEYHEYEG
ncbi:MAG: VOC family protein [Ignavibacteria bacterium]|nr:VOC family protein [Ignavibacteria bacterium]